MRTYVRNILFLVLPAIVLCILLLIFLSHKKSVSASNLAQVSPEQILDFLKLQQCPEDVQCRLEDFVVEFIDLNEDHKSDLMIRPKKGASSEGWMCWSNQCVTGLALQMPSGEFRSIGGWPNHSFTVMKTSTNGLKDLNITYREAGESEVELVSKKMQWNGVEYSVVN